MITLYITRNKYNGLWLHFIKPDYVGEEYISEHSMPLPVKLFPEIRKDEYPKEVNLCLK